MMSKLLFCIVLLTLFLWIPAVNAEEIEIETEGVEAGEERGSPWLRGKDPGDRGFEQGAKGMDRASQKSGEGFKKAEEGMRKSKYGYEHGAPGLKRGQQGSQTGLGHGREGLGRAKRERDSMNKGPSAIPSKRGGPPAGVGRSPTIP